MKLSKRLLFGLFYCVVQEVSISHPGNLIRTFFITLTVFGLVRPNMCVLTSVIKLVYSFEDFKVFPKDFVSSTLKSANKDKHPSNVRLSIEFYLLVIKGWKIKIWLRLIKSVKKEKTIFSNYFPFSHEKLLTLYSLEKDDKLITDHSNEGCSSLLLFIFKWPIIKIEKKTS